MEKAKDVKEFVERIDASKKKNPKDLSSDQDLTIALMNLISIEEHLIFSGAKTGKTAFYDMVQDIRELRKNLMLKVIPSYEGEVWCISKHLLATSMRLMEVGTKQQSMGRNEDAYALFNQAYDLYCLFWGLNMGLVDMNGVTWAEDSLEKVQNDVDNIKKGTMASLNSSKPDTKTAVVKDVSSSGVAAGMGQNNVPSDSDASQGGMFSRLKAVVKKAVDCCIE